MNWDLFRLETEGMMMHPGLTDPWITLLVVGMILITIRRLFSKNITPATRKISLRNAPVIGDFLQGVVTRPWFLLTIRLLSVAIFLLVIISGLFGTPIPERNLATALTWTLWWTGLIISIYFVGSAWCAVCPWDVLATWLARFRLWRRAHSTNSLQLRVPKSLRNIWPASGMFIILTWLELGYGMTTSPYATAVLSLAVVVLALLSQVTYERKAFCRYFCSVGRTIGFYSSLSPVALRPIDESICASCKTLECYHGNQDIEPCPTNLVLGRTKQNSFCTSCGACSQSCPYQNINWGLRKTAEEAIHYLRPHWDEAWFIMILLSLTSFHGLTMLPGWEQWVSQLAVRIGDSGQLLWSFSTGMVLTVLIPISLFANVVLVLQKTTATQFEFKRLFSLLALPFIPLAFAYHLAHNLNHLFRESSGLSEVFMNPLGINVLPLSQHEIHLRHMSPLISQQLIFALQAGLMLLGFWLATQILMHRVSTVTSQTDRNILSGVMLILIAGVTLFNVWLLMQPMVMRM